MNDHNNEALVVESTPSNAVAPQTMMGGLSVAGASNGSNMALANAAAAEAIGMIMAAKSTPRDERICLSKIQNACGRTKLAELSQYELARGGTNIAGPSIHLLRAIAAYWGNVKSGSVITESTGMYTKGKAFAWDMESNRVVEVPFDVRHIRHTRKGDFPLTNPDDIRYLVNNYASRSERKALESVIPEDVVQQAADWCNETLRADMGKFDANRMLAAFDSYGVTKDDIEAFTQRSIDALKDSPGNVVRLRKILNSLKDGIAKKEDFFKGDTTVAAPAAPDKEKGSPAPAPKAKKATIESALAEVKAEAASEPAQEQSVFIRD